MPGSRNGKEGISALTAAGPFLALPGSCKTAGPALSWNQERRQDWQCPALSGSCKDGGRIDGQRPARSFLFLESRIGIEGISALTAAPTAGPARSFPGIQERQCPAPSGSAKTAARPFPGIQERRQDWHCPARPIPFRH